MALSQTTRLNLAKHAVGDLGWGPAQNTGMDDADARFFLEGAGTPVVTVTTSQYVGQRYWDSLTERWWTALSAPAIDWKIDADILVAGGTIAGNVILQGSLDITGASGDVTLDNLRGYFIKDSGAVARNIASVDGANLLKVGDQALTGGISLQADGIDEATIDYGSSPQKIFHAGNSGDFMPRTPDDTGTVGTDLTTVAASTAHGLTSPILAHCWIECIHVSGDANYHQFDKVPVAWLGDTVFEGSQSSISGFTAWYNDTDVGYSADLGLFISDRDSGSMSSMDETRWQFNYALWDSA